MLVADGGMIVNVGLNVTNVDVIIGRLEGVAAGLQEERRVIRIKTKNCCINLESASLLASIRNNFRFLNAILVIMDEVFKVYPHNPPHYFVPNAMYMITGAILHNQYLLNENRKKEFVLETLFERSKLLGWGLEAWAILNNHYHLVAQAPENVNTLSKLIRQAHSITAIQLNDWDNARGRQVWFNYWDSCLTYEKSYLARLHYVHMNPVKHGLVEDPLDYPYCSYRWFIERVDEKLRKQVFEQQIDRVNVFDDF